ncbi:Agamous-like MADS-box protein AGL82 [Camellia lanceoleosa]|uniref:Agamous-like MADS-box protein AGL82 n=1 Tax=Camellia lanceoleosa TaxID=1840588 RepID=A0ACC0GTD5_9ERIC|nr:Agamous-like MADS-box protein AGL82 [Camellia lanceoleosa]
MVKQIENSKARRLTYKRRLNCIKKKTMELTTLCGINACLVCLGPNGEVETWPEKPSDVRDVISKYKGPSEIESESESETDVLDEKIEEVEKEIEAIKKKNLGKILRFMQLKRIELPKRAI